jgi:hypothetical protein
MFLNVEKALIQNKCLVMPQVYIRPEVEKNVRDKVKSIINGHHGYITGKLFIFVTRATVQCSVEYFRASEYRRLRRVFEAI